MKETTKTSVDCPAMQSKSLSTWRFVMQLIVVDLEETPSKPHLISIFSKFMKKTSSRPVSQKLPFCPPDFFDHLLSPGNGKDLLYPPHEVPNTIGWKNPP